MPYSDTIIGKDVFLYFLVNGIYQQAACATECSLNVYTDTVEVTTRTNNPGQGRWKKIKGIGNYWEGSVSGIQLLDTPVKFSDIRQMQTELTPVYIQYAKEGKGGANYENWFGIGVITSTEETAGVDDFATFDIRIEGNGVLNADFTATNLNQPIEMFYYYIATGSEGRVIHIPDLQGKVISGRIYRDGFENDPSGMQTMNRPGTDVPVGNQYSWDYNTALLVLSADSPTASPGERITIPYTNNYNGCSLFIQNFKVGLDSNNHFKFTWMGTGLPESQLIFEYSADYGANWTVIDTDMDALNLDNAIYNTTLDAAGNYIFRITPVCTNSQKGKPSQAYWNASVATIINDRTDGAVISYITINDTVNTSITNAATDEFGDQLPTVTFNKDPYSGSRLIQFNISPASFPCTIVVKDKNGSLLGTGNTQNNTQTSIGVILSNSIPNEFTVIIS